MFFRFRNRKQSKNSRSHAGQDQPTDHDPSSGLGGPLAETLGLLRKHLGTSPDIVLRELEDGENRHRLALCYIDGLIDSTLLTELMESLVHTLSDPGFSKEAAFLFIKKKVPFGDISAVSNMDNILTSMLNGFAVIIVEGTSAAIAVALQGGIRRAIEEPSSQTVIRGPKEGFTEELSTNIALIRRKLRTPDLRLELFKLGKYTQTNVALLYIQGLARPEVVSEMTSRLKSINTDSILESGYIEELIQDAAITPFPTIMNTERPDTIAGNLLEGQAVIVVDGTPFVLIAPVTFFKFFQSSEDYYQRYDLATFLRIIRFTSFVIAMLLPSLYIAVTTFHQEMLPTTLLVSLAAQREGTPLPALLEALLMEVTFEIIREAGVRMPRQIGPAISIVGALVLGQAAVQAGLVSGAMVIVVSFTAISNFVLPNINMASSVRLVRFAFMFLAGTFGFFGIMAGAVPLLVHLISLRSFGVPYFLPISPVWKRNWKDVFVRAPWWAMKQRPAVIAGDNTSRQGSGQKPGPPES